MTIDPGEFEQHYYRAAYLFSRFTVPYLRNVYREFEGDMLINIVLGEIGTRNVGRFFDTSEDYIASETLLDDVTEHQRVLRPCNALSISDATGIAPETSTGGGTSDARYFKDVCPVVEFGLVGETMHQIDERVPLADLATLTAIYRAFLDRMFGSPR